MKRGGEYAPVTGEELRELRTKHGLSQIQLAVLARSSLTQKKNGTFYARRVHDWEHDKSRIPLPCWELINLKLKLMEYGASFDEVAENTAAEVAANLMARYRDTLNKLAK